MATPLRFLLLLVLATAGSAAAASGASFQVFTDFESWQAAAGAFRSLDFASDRVLSPTANYADLGVIFEPFADVDTLAQSDGELVATDEGPFGFGPAGLAAVFPTPVHFVAAHSGGYPHSCFGGCPILDFGSMLRVFGEDGSPLELPSGVFGDEAYQRMTLGDFFGIAADVPISRVELLGVGNYRIGPTRLRVADFHFAVPEPASAVLVCVGCAALAARRRIKPRAACPAPASRSTSARRTP